jgi:dipeptidyl aminopeptidase/acylaminoacyl peptidase
MTHNQSRFSRRAFLAGLAGSLYLVDKASAAFPDTPPLIAGDYALARMSFHTHLLKLGPAPDDGGSLTPPGGAQLLQYQSGGLSLAAWRSVPSKNERHKRPAMLFLHGGNALGEGHWDLVRPYLRVGYVVMMPAFRAENGQAGAFSGFYDETGDVVAAARALAIQPDVDPSRIFVAGHSIGGTLTLLAVLSSSMFRGASSFSGNPSAFAFFEHFPEDIRFDAGDIREFEMRSAVCYATSFKCPVLMLHGAREARMDAPSDLTASRAKVAGLKVESTVVPGDHFSALPEEIRRSLAFFAKLGSGAGG